jgi:molecular chaperone DnaK
MNDASCVVGIDLGTTNSEIAAFLDGQVRVLGPANARMLPSCVGFSPSGELLVGQSARNQQLLYPERTVRSIKRKMGSPETVTLADKTFTPQEISALILRELTEWGARALGRPVERAVITVPAYFSDAQRQATREAGTLAGLDVVRILNEPTAASLAYGFADSGPHTAMIYDLGGGTFDVSIVTLEGDVTEVLASHGNNHLGGDDFDDLLVEHLEQAFAEQYGINLRQGHAAAHARLWWAAEEAKKRLSFEPYVTIREEALVSENGKPLHFELELSRQRFEDLIRPLVESTLDSVSKALDDSRKSPSDLDVIVLVGGSTRIPLVSRLLEERAGLEPRQEVHPDLCVALGAGVLASRLAGHAVERVLVDVSPYSFGTSFLAERGGVPYPHCYRPIIRRNTPLPVTRTESYCTAYPYQEAVKIDVYQGDDDDALKNILIGEFSIEGLTPIEEPNEVLNRMSLDLDGILHVAAIEKRTGKSKQITITNALGVKTNAEIAAARQRLKELYSSRSSASTWAMEEADMEEEEEENGSAVMLARGAAAGAAEPSAEGYDPVPGGSPPAESAWTQLRQAAEVLLERSRQLMSKLHEEDKDEAIELHERIAAAIAAQDAQALTEASKALKELLFFVEGR